MGALNGRTYHVHNKITNSQYIVISDEEGEKLLKDKNFKVVIVDYHISDDNGDTWKSIFNVDYLYEEKE